MHCFKDIANAMCDDVSDNDGMSFVLQNISETLDMTEASVWNHHGIVSEVKVKGHGLHFLGFVAEMWMELLPSVTNCQLHDALESAD